MILRRHFLAKTEENHENLEKSLCPYRGKKPRAPQIQICSATATERWEIKEIDPVE
jgi:hypothetical protein